MKTPKIGRLCIASLGVVCALASVGCGSSQPSAPSQGDSSVAQKTSSLPLPTQPQPSAPVPKDKPSEPAVQAPPPPASSAPPSATVQLPAFTPPSGCEELQAGLKQNEDDLVEQGIAVLSGSDAASVALKTIGLAVLKHKPELADAAKQLDTVSPANPYDVALVAIAHAAMGQTVDPNPKALSASLETALKPLEGGSQCAVAYYAAARLERMAGDKGRAKTYSDEAHRRDQP